ncbi:MAG: glycogen/starch synthase [Bacteroidales bacterium]|nr:glycogen/starch synthase [Bacteroidales bacterium]
MKRKKILHIAQEIHPYVSEGEAALAEYSVIKAISTKGGEVRVFMPKWGEVNERRNQLHEVIRLSGLNIDVDDSDHSLIIKVANIQALRTQIYFIDNDDFFTGRLMAYDEGGKVYADNVHRAAFYARGVLETVKRLRWNPDIIHCHGWMSAIAVLYIKELYRDLPQFEHAKVVFSAYDDMLIGQSTEDFLGAISHKEVNAESLAKMGLDTTKYDALYQIALQYADAFVAATADVPAEVLAFAEERGLPMLHYNEEQDLATIYSDFYSQLTAGE